MLDISINGIALQQCTNPSNSVGDISAACVAQCRASPDFNACFCPCTCLSHRADRVSGSIILVQQYHRWFRHKNTPYLVCCALFLRVAKRDSLASSVYAPLMCMSLVSLLVWVCIQVSERVA